MCMEFFCIQIDRMSADMAVELKGTGVSCITLYPGPVLTEMINDKLGSGAANVSHDSWFLGNFNIWPWNYLHNCMFVCIYAIIYLITMRYDLIISLVICYIPSWSCPFTQKGQKTSILPGYFAGPKLELCLLVDSPTRKNFMPLCVPHSWNLKHVQLFISHW